MPTIGKDYILADFVVLAWSWWYWDQRLLDYRSGENYLLYSSIFSPPPTPSPTSS